MTPKEIVEWLLPILDTLIQGSDLQESTEGLMRLLIQDLLDYSQIKNGKFRKQFVNFKVFEAV
jgi:hypothetical protein